MRETGDIGLVERGREVLQSEGIVLQFDTFSGEVLVDRKCITDLDRARITLAIRRAGLKITSQLLDAVILVLADQNRTHPVREYLDGLRWDGVPRVDTWLQDLMGAKNEAFERAVGAITLIAAVRRVRQPGCKFDECLVLVGDEGIGKSTILRDLGRPWFSDSLPLGAGSKETVERTTGIWICESAELIGNTPAKIAEIKAFLSRAEDGPFRAAYARHSSMRARQFIPVATTNDSVFLHSTTGDRRFWPVRVYYVDAAKVNRDQLWAEAAAREARGESIRLPENLWSEAFGKQEKYRAQDPWESKLRDLGDGPISLLDILGLLGIQVGQSTMRDAMRVAGIMAKLGYEKSKRRVDGSRGTYYEKPNPYADLKPSLPTSDDTPVDHSNQPSEDDYE